MSKMKDLWGDTIKVVNVDNEYIGVAFTEKLSDSRWRSSMELDAAMTREFIKKLKKALAEVEGV